MNVSELARRVNVPPQELYELLNHILFTLRLQIGTDGLIIQKSHDVHVRILMLSVLSFF